MARAKKPVARRIHRKLQPKPPAAAKSRIRPAKLRQAAFLAAFAATASVTGAAKASRIPRDCHYQWLETDPKYGEAFERTRSRAVQLLVDEAVRRAREGTEKPVYYQGEECGAILEYSDSLLMFLLRAWDSRYKDKTELSGPGGGPVVVDIAERLNAARKRIAAEPHAE